MVMEDLWTCKKKYGYNSDGDLIKGQEISKKLQKDLWFELDKSMWRKNQLVFQDHMKYIHNNIVKYFRVRIIQYAKCVRQMHNLAKLLPTPQKKGGMFDHADWSVRNKEFAEDEIFIAIKDGFHILNLIQIKCKV